MLAASNRLFAAAVAWNGPLGKLAEERRVAALGFFRDLCSRSSSQDRDGRNFSTQGCSFVGLSRLSPIGTELFRLLGSPR
jgi:hypothetical protein